MTQKNKFIVPQQPEPLRPQDIAGLRKMIRDDNKDQIAGFKKAIVTLEEDALNKQVAIDANEKDQVKAHAIFRAALQNDPKLLADEKDFSAKNQLLDNAIKETLLATGIGRDNKKVMAGIIFNEAIIDGKKEANAYAHKHHIHHGLPLEIKVIQDNALTKSKMT